MNGSRGRRDVMMFGLAAMTAASLDVKVGLAKKTAATKIPSNRVPTGSTATAIAWSSDSRYLVAALEAGTRLSVFHATGAAYATLLRRDAMALSHYIDFASAPNNVLFAPPGMIASTAGLCVYSIQTERLIVTLPGHGLDSPFCLSKNGRLLVLSQRKSVVVFDAQNWAKLREIVLPGEFDIIASIQCGLDAEFVAGTVRGRIYTGNAATGSIRMVGSLYSDGGADGDTNHLISALAVAPQGRQAVAVAYPAPHSIRMVDHDAPVRDAARIIDLATGQIIASNPFPLAIHGLYNVAWHPENRAIMILDGDGTLLFWDPTTFATRVVDRTGHFVGAGLAFSPDGGVLAVSARDSIELIPVEQLVSG